jgi:hypothetical protein
MMDNAISPKKPVTNIDLTPEQHTSIFNNKSALSLILIFFVIILTFIAVYSYIFVLKREIKAAVNTQALNFKNLVKVFDQIESANSFDPEDEINQSDVFIMNKNDYLSEQEYLSKLNLAIQDLVKIQNQNSQLEKLYIKNSLLRPMLPNISTQILDTKLFSTNSVNSLKYFKSITEINMSLKSKFTDLNQIIKEAILNNAEAQTVDKYSSKITEIEMIHRNYETINISSLPENLQKEHVSNSKLLNQKVLIYNNVETALKNKDPYSLRDVLNTNSINLEMSENLFLLNQKNNRLTQSQSTQITGLEKAWQEAFSKF